MPWAIVERGVVSRILKTPKALEIAGVHHGPETFFEWDLDQLRAIGIFPLRELPKKIRKYNQLTERHLSILETEIVEKAQAVPKPVETIRRIKISELRAKALSSVGAGIHFNGKLFATDLPSLTMLNTVVLGWLADGDLPDGLRWSVMDGEVAVMNGNSLHGLMKTVMKYITRCKRVEANHLKALQECSDARALIDYDLGRGWPESTRDGF